MLTSARDRRAQVRHRSRSSASSASWAPGQFATVNAPDFAAKFTLGSFLTSWKLVVYCPTDHVRYPDWTSPIGQIADSIRRGTIGHVDELRVRIARKRQSDEPICSADRASRRRVRQTVEDNYANLSSSGLPFGRLIQEIGRTALAMNPPCPVDSFRSTFRYRGFLALGPTILDQLASSVDGTLLFDVNISSMKVALAPGGEEMMVLASTRRFQPSPRVLFLDPSMMPLCGFEWCFGLVLRVWAAPLQLAH